MVKQDFAKAKNLDPNATATGAAEVEKMANKQREAAKQLFDRLQSYEMDVYFCDWSSGQPYPLEKAEWGHFYSDDTYIIDLKGKNHRYIVMWIGPHLNFDQYTETSKFFDVLTNYVNSQEITRQRVQRGHEEESLLSLFPNGFMIYQGNRMGNLEEKVAAIKHNGAMFRIQAPYGDSARAIEQPTIKCENLNSGDAYIISAPGGENVYLWMGEGANDAERNLGKKIFTNYFDSAPVKVEVKETEEPEEFWGAFLGGKTEYSNSKNTGIALGFDPRLFHASNAQGYFHVEEVPNFTQDDMMNDDIMLLDAYTTIYVWIGNGSNKFERNGAFKTAQRYI
jgi:Gelsolin repeat